MSRKRNILLTPGPITTTQAVKDAMVFPDVCPREDEFSEVLQSIRQDLLKLANADDDDWTAVLFASSGTGAMEACANCAMPKQGYTTATKKQALVLSNGIYGARFAEILALLNQGVLTLHSTPTLPYNLFKKTINDTFGAVFMTHHETTTGVLNEIGPISRVTTKKDIPLIVDAISSFGAVPIDVPEMGIDYLISVPNKCIQGMPGLSFVILNKKRIRDALWNSGSTYFNLGLEYRFQERGQMRFTAPVQVMYAFRQALDELFKEGMYRRYQRYQKIYNSLVQGMHNRGFESYLDDDAPRSKLIEAFKYPKNFNFKEFHDKMWENGITVYPIPSIKDTFRLGCTGDLKMGDITRFLSLVDDYES